ncbi:MAG: hypothetical protein ACPG8W_06925 [Candidatus Promineifilaceae bacterium]
MFKRIFDNFDDIDPKKLVEVVNLVWNNRDKFMDLIERMPALLRETGNSIESAGTSAMKASVFLVGDDDGSPSAKDISVMAANALERCQTELVEAAQIMAKIGDDIDDIRIPSFRPKHTEVLGIKVVNGFEMGENQLIDNAAGRLQQGASRLSEIGKDLRLVADNLRDLGGVLADTGGDLNNLGDQLRLSGQTLRSFGEWDTNDEKPSSGYNDPGGFVQNIG